MGPQSNANEMEGSLPDDVQRESVRGTYTRKRDGLVYDYSGTVVVFRRTATWYVKVHRDGKLVAEFADHALVETDVVAFLLSTVENGIEQLNDK
jgi:hypothetical protein